MGELSNPQPGKRSDLDAVQDTIRNGGTIAKVAEEHFGCYVKYHRGIERAMSLLLAPRNFKSEVIVYWGETGSGKTRRAMESDNAPTWIYSSDGWFDGYVGDEIVLFDDFGGHEFKITYLLKLLDRYPMRVRIKGGFVQWCPKTIYITSNVDPNLWYPNARQQHRDALARRIEKIEYI